VPEVSIGSPSCSTNNRYNRSSTMNHKVYNVAKKPYHDVMFRFGSEGKPGSWSGPGDFRFAPFCTAFISSCILIGNCMATFASGYVFMTVTVPIVAILSSTCTRVGTLIVATIYLQLIQNRYMFRSFTVLQCSRQHCVQPVTTVTRA